MARRAGLWGEAMADADKDRLKYSAKMMRLAADAEFIGKRLNDIVAGFRDGVWTSKGELDELERRLWSILVRLRAL